MQLIGFINTTPSACSWRMCVEHCCQDSAGVSCAVRSKWKTCGAPLLLECTTCSEEAPPAILETMLGTDSTNQFRDGDSASDLVSCSVLRLEIELLRHMTSPLPTLSLEGMHEALELPAMPKRVLWRRGSTRGCMGAMPPQHTGRAACDVDAIMAAASVTLWLLEHDGRSGLGEGR